ncbi:hypothetical protein F2Q68_00015679 [Brassica cretica]|uniref:Retrotransposon gag domain-containing protein n=1 Tax=Brassica cretica TaxID=69181 RepID=A0A8S9HGI3_BRACR|nr:hypothetical protein F2Q68_00015679 [Brassica cretica]
MAEEANPELSPEVQSLKEKLNEHYKQLEQSAEKLSQLELENLNLRDENQALNTASNKKRRFQAQIRPMPTLETPNSGTGVNLPPTASGGDASAREKAKDAQTYDVEDSESETELDKEAPDGATKAELLWSLTFTRCSPRGSMPCTQEKFSFPSIKAYDGTTDPDDHVAQYRQRMLAIALPKDWREATMCKGFGSTLTGPTLQWYINLPSRSIASFAILSDKFVEQFASSRDLEKTSDGLYEILQHRVGLLPDWDLYKELTKYQCKTMEDVLSRAWAHVKWEEDVASRAKAQQKQDPKMIISDRIERDEKPSQRPARDSGNRNRGRYQNRPIE